MKQFSMSSFANLEYELIALHPEHFLRSLLTVYDPAARTYKNYVAARDQCVRESPDPDSPHLPTFRHTSEDRGRAKQVNIFSSS
jgi:hypothetical protein